MSDFPPPSAINKKNKKKNNKKKNKKQENVAPSPPVEGISYADAAALPAEEVGSNDSSPPNERTASDVTSDVNADITTASDTPSCTKGASAAEKTSAASNIKDPLVAANTDTIPTTGAPSFAEIAASTPTESPTNTPSEPVSEIVEYTIQSVIASRSIHIDEIIDKIAKRVKAGEYNTSSVPAVSNKSNKPSPDESDQLSDLVKYSIDSVVASQSIGLYAIVDKIANNVKEGKYNTSSAKSTPNTKQAPSQVVPATTPSFQLSDPVKHSIKTAIASRSIHLHAIVDKIAKKVHAGDYKSLPKKESQRPEKTLPEVVAGSAIAAVTSAVAGTAAVISEKLSSATKTTKLSENVEHCIQSAVKAHSLDMYAILHPKSNLKRPEAAVGETMPSSAKKADIVLPVQPTQKKSDSVLPKKPDNVLPKKPDNTPPKHSKPSEARKPNPERKKKKDCIIL